MTEDASVAKLLELAARLDRIAGALLADGKFEDADAVFAGSVSVTLDMLRSLRGARVFEREDASLTVIDLG